MNDDEFVNDNDTAITRYFTNFTFVIGGGGGGGGGFVRKWLDNHCKLYNTIPAFF